MCANSSTGVSSIIRSCLRFLGSSTCSCMIDSPTHLPTKQHDCILLADRVSFSMFGIRDQIISSLLVKRVGSMYILFNKGCCRRVRLLTYITLNRCSASLLMRIAAFLNMILPSCPKWRILRRLVDPLCKQV